MQSGNLTFSSVIKNLTLESLFLGISETTSFTCLYTPIDKKVRLSSFAEVFLPC